MGLAGDKTVVGASDWAAHGSVVPGSGENEENGIFRLI